MEEDIHSIEKNNIWELTALSEDNQVIGVKWVYKMKQNAHGEVERYKVRLLAKDYKQRHGIDYEEVYELVAPMETIHLLISLAEKMKCKIHQLDVKSAFLNGYLEKEVYVEKPLGFMVKNYEDKVLRFKKVLYGLKQAPRACNSCIDKYFQDNGFTRCLHDYAL